MYIAGIPRCAVRGVRRYRLYLYLDIDIEIGILIDVICICICICESSWRVQSAWREETRKGVTNVCIHTHTHTHTHTFV